MLPTRRHDKGSFNVPNVVMRSVFNCRQRGMNVCHVNAGSVFPKIDQFRRIFETSNAHLIFVSETWFKTYRSNVSIAVDGYDVLRNDRCVRQSGGVAVYVRKGVKTRVIRSSTGLLSEYLFFEVIFPNEKILFAAYYKAPKVDEIAEFDAVLTDLSPKYSDTVLLGDFNENLLLHDSNGICKKCVHRTCSVCRFSACMMTHGMKSIGTAPTNFDGVPTQLDLILSNSPDKFTVFNQIDSGISNHDILFATLA